MHRLCAFLVCLLAARLCAAQQAQPSTRPGMDPVSAFFETGPIPQLNIVIGEKELESLRQKPREFVSCTVHERLPGLPDRRYNEVGVHLKAGAGSFRGVDDRPALTVKFDHELKGQAFHGLEKIHLNNSVQDPSYTWESLSRWVFREAGIPAARATHARVWINGRDVGLYVLVESMDNDYVKRAFGPGAGTLYEGPFVNDIDQPMRRMAHGPAGKPPSTAPAELEKFDRARFDKLLVALRERDVAKRRERVAEVLDVDRFHTFMAIEAMLAHWDGYCNNRNNYRVYHDPQTSRLIFLPHGLDQLFGIPDYPLFQGAGVVARTLLEDPEQREKYLDRVAELRTKLFTAEILNARVDLIARRIMPVLETISAQAVRRQKEQVGTVKYLINLRLAAIDRQLKASRPLKFDGSGVAALSNWEPNQQGGSTALDRANEGGKPILRIRCASGDSVASWRTMVLLTKGKYRFEGRCKTAGVAPGNPQSDGVDLRISGGQPGELLKGDTDWKDCAYDFEVGEPSRQVVLVCELRARSGQAMFDAESLKLRRR